MSPFCPEPERLSGWLDGTLPEQERASLASHLAKCDDCRRAVALARISIDSAPSEPAADVAVERWVAGVARRPTPAWPARVGILAAAALLVAITLFIVFRRPHTATPPEQALKPAETRTEAKRTEPATEPKREEPRTEEPKDEKKVEPKREEKKEEPKKEETAKEEPKREEPKKEETAKPDRKPGVTRPDLSVAYVSVALLDGTGDLWIRRADQEDYSKISGSFKSGFGQPLRAGKSPAAFTVEGRATLAMEPETTLWVARAKESCAFAVQFESGSAIIDSEGTSQRWEIGFGEMKLEFPTLSGRVLVETADTGIRTHVLDGHAEAYLSGKLRAIEQGKFLEAGEVKKGNEALYKKKLARLKEIRPKVRTLFAARFDADDAFGYSIAAGRLNKEKNFLSADVPTQVFAKGAFTPDVICGLKLGEEAIYLTGMTLRIKYRGNTDTILVRAGKFVGKINVKRSESNWMIADVVLSALEDEGVPMVSGDAFGDLYFATPKVDQKSRGDRVLDIGSVELVRSAQ